MAGCKTQGDVKALICQSLQAYHQLLHAKKGSVLRVEYIKQVDKAVPFHDPLKRP